jgi:thiamine biosynthesis lipoprotein
MGHQLFSWRAVAGVAFTAWLWPPAPATPLHHLQVSRISMACLYTIDAYAADAEKLSSILEQALDEVDRIDRLMSHYKPESPLSRINRDAAASPVAVEPELYDFIAEAIRYSRDSDGAFDITVGPLMKVWGFFRGEGRLPSDQEIETVRPLVGWQHIIMDPEHRTIRFDRPGVELDLGGIAKGYAVDRVVKILRTANVAAALVSAGGSTIYGLGAPPTRNAWAVSIQDPVDSGRVARDVELRDRALSVAGSSEKSFEVDGVRYSHIMDPRTGRPVQGVLTVAVVTKTGTEGDALDDALFVLGPVRSRKYLKRLDAVEMFFFLPDGQKGWTLIHEPPW